MKIVNREEFLRLPSGTLYAPYEPCIFGGLCIKGDSLFSVDNQPIDFYCVEIANSLESSGSEEFFDRAESMMRDGASFPVDLQNVGRDGLFEEEQLYAIWEKKDVQSLISELQKSLLNFQ